MIKFCIFLAFICVVQNASVEPYKTYKNYKLYKITGYKTDIDYLKEKLGKYIDEFPYYGASDVGAIILISPEIEPFLKEIIDNTKLKASILIKDYSEIIRSENVNQNRKKGFSWTAYYDVDDIYGYLQNTSRAYPNCTQVVVGGQSYEGRQILGLRINTPSVKKTGKPAVFIESGIHAREWITPATTTYFINQLLTSSDPKVTALRDQFDWHIFPTVNPDGYHYTFTNDRMWRKTRSKSSNGCYGADPNRNWDYNWLQHGASDSPCNYQLYAGSKPFSEIETRTLSSYVSGLENLLAYIAFHADAQMLLVPYSDSTEHVDNYDDLIQIGNMSLKYGYEVNKQKYRGPATAAEILYKASGGSMDWVKHSLGTPLAYTFELRGYYFHWPASRIYEQGDEVTQMMVGFSTEAQKLGYF